MSSPTADATVLVVEDDPELLAVYADWLGRRWSVRTAADGDAAVDALDPEIDVVVVDRKLPGRSGDAVVEHLHEQGWRCGVVLVTALEPDADLLGVRFDDYVQKPTDRSELVGAVERVHRRSEYETTVREYYAAVEKLVVVGSELDTADLECRDDLAALESRVRELRREAAAAVGEFEPRDYRALFNGLDAAGAGQASSS